MQDIQEYRAITINIIHNRSKAVDYEGAEKGLILIFMLGIMLCNNFPLRRHYNGNESQTFLDQKMTRKWFWEILLRKKKR